MPFSIIALITFLHTFIYKNRGKIVIFCIFCEKNHQKYNFHNFLHFLQNREIKLQSMILKMAIFCINRIGAWFFIKSCDSVFLHFSHFLTRKKHLSYMLKFNWCELQLQISCKSHQLKIKYKHYITTVKNVIFIILGVTI